MTRAAHILTWFFGGLALVTLLTVCAPIATLCITGAAWWRAMATIWRGA